MMRKLIDLFRPQGTIGPIGYLATGVIAFALKYSIDRVAAALLMHRAWLPWEYLNPLSTTAGLLALGPAERRFLLAMSVIALPFIWLGISVTMKRLRSAGLPLWMVAMFFVPVISLVFFLVLSMVPPRRKVPAPVSQADDSGRRVDGLVAVVISTAICLSAAWLGTKTMGKYGLGLFVAVPFCVGLITVVIYTWRTPRRYGECVFAALIAISIAGVGMLAFVMEGVICLIMAAPVAWTLAALGATVGYWIQQPFHSRSETIALVLLLALVPPAVMASESEAPPEFAVRTSIKVNAPPEVVWRHVVSFSQLPDPSEWLFRAGIAYPIRAEIHGQGAGAVRYCVFSTGPFVEPITVWDEPRLLEFNVTKNPPAMRELSPYGDLHPRHLDGYLVSHRGRFLLTPLADGRTRLEGTTWYEHGLWPSSYWRIWSDYILHRIHLRVLNHIRQLAEQRQQS